MCVNRVLAVLVRQAAAALAVLTGYKLIADSGNQNRTSDNKAPLIVFVVEYDRGYIHTL